MSALVRMHPKLPPMAYADRAKKALRQMTQLMAERPPAQCPNPRFLGAETSEGRRYLGEAVSVRIELEKLVRQANAPGNTLEERLCNARLSADDLAWTQSLRRYCNQVVHVSNASQKPWDGRGNFEWCRSAAAYIAILAFISRQDPGTRTPSPQSRRDDSGHDSGRDKQLNIELREYALREAHMRRRYENLCKEIDVEYLESWAQAPYDDSLDGRWMNAMAHVRAFCRTTATSEAKVVALINQGAANIEVVGTSFGEGYAGHAKGILDYDSMLVAFRCARE